MRADLFRQGSTFALFAIVESERCQILDYIDSLQKAEQRKLIALLERVTNHGPPRNEEKSKPLREDLFEFKSFQDRVIWFYDGKGRIVMTHAFQKKGGPVPPEEIRKAKRLRQAYQAYIEARGRRP
jgi:phage-related protein